MNSDTTFSIGKGHKVCEDYARHGETAAGQLVLVSDGCSSSADTDIGARVLVMAAEEFLFRNPHADREAMGQGTLVKARSVLAMTARPPECLDATLLVGRVERDGIARVYAWGDGVIAGQRRDGSWVVFVITYASGAPAYLNYQDSPRMPRYCETFGTAFTITTYESDGTVSEEGDENPNLDAHVFEFDPAKFQMVLLCSDGVESFYTIPEGTTAPEPIPTPDVMTHLMGIRHGAGEFVARRVQNRFLGRHCKKKGWLHHDDLAVGGLWLDLPEVEVEGGGEA